MGGGVGPIRPFVSATAERETSRKPERMSREQALKKLSAIPPFPAVVRKLMSMVASDHSDMRMISEVLKADAVLAGESLRIANSALFALRHEVTSVLHAISVLGLDRLKSVVVTVGLRKCMKAGTGASQRCWRHNLATALVAEQMAAACELNRATVYTAGLLHGIGYAALAACFEDAWEAALGERARSGRNLAEIEADVIGITHLEAAEWLVHYWELPPSFLATSRCSHEAGGVMAVADMAQVVALACDGADWLGFAPWSAGADWDSARLMARLPEAAGQRMAATVDLLPEHVPYKINDFEMTFLR
jgi:HD-like signal output (HDOD) protein